MASRTVLKPAPTGIMRVFPTAPQSPVADLASPSLNPLDTLWQTKTLVWVLALGEAVAIILSLAPGVTGDRLTYFGVASLLVQWICLTSLTTLYLLRHKVARLSPPSIARIGFGALILSTWTVLMLGWLLLGDLPITSQGGWRALCLQVTAIATIMGLLGLAAFQAQWKARQLAVTAEQSKLQALKARIQPHFLFNTLNTGIALLHVKPDSAEQLLLDLSDLFRAALSQRDTIPLTEDLSLARRYLEIEQLRLGERLRLEWDLPAALPELEIPTLSVQPLAENAIRHGIEPSTAGGEVHVQIRLASRLLEVSVINTLSSAPMRPTTGHQVGLSSVRARIHALTQGRGSVETTTADGRYTAIIRLPLDA